MSEERTITVSSWTGRDKQMTKDEFTEVWTDHVNELLRIDYDSEWLQYVDSVKETVKARCHAEFDKLYEKQNVVVAKQPMGTEDV